MLYKQHGWAKKRERKTRCSKRDREIEREWAIHSLRVNCAMESFCVCADASLYISNIFYIINRMVSAISYTNLYLLFLLCADFFLFKIPRFLICLCSNFFVLQMRMLLAMNIAEIEMIYSKSDFGSNNCYYFFFFFFFFVQLYTLLGCTVFHLKFNLISIYNIKCNLI